MSRAGEGGLRHIGWWSEHDGFTPSDKDEPSRVRRWCIAQGWQPVYIKPEEAPDAK